jgi:two-component system sensor kinase FixL
MDVTTRKLAEDQAKKAEAEAQRSREELAHVGRVSTMGEVAGSLAHELSQPLSAILTNAQAARLLMFGDRRDDDQARDALKDITEEALRARDIISGIRSMLKKEPGQMATLDLNVAVRAVLELVRHDLAARRVQPVLRLDPQLPPVTGHAVQLRQVILNLVLNACEAMVDTPADRRTLAIETKRVMPEEVQVSVADNGPGFSDEMLRRACEPFNTTKANGLGLGLAISRSIITAHGGQLIAANNTDKGATVTLTLPAHKSHKATGP